jgi:hypothetical protein
MMNETDSSVPNDLQKLLLSLPTIGAFFNDLLTGFTSVEKTIAHGMRIAVTSSFGKRNCSFQRLT